jgi:hypothetical protein
VALPDPGNALWMQTRSKGLIPNELRPERNPAALKASVELMRGLFPEAICRSITATYNCVGVVVASRRVWVDPDHLVRILKEDGCRKLAREEEADVGDVVIYHDEGGSACHVGVVVRKNVLRGEAGEELLTVLSKWGADGEYIHAASYVPALLGRPAEYWTDRRSA